MSLLRIKKYIRVLVTCRCSMYDPFRSMQYCIPPSNAEQDNIRVEYSVRNNRSCLFNNNEFQYAYTRDKEGNLYDFVRVA